MKYLYIIPLMLFTGCAAREYGEAVVDQAPEIISTVGQAATTGGWTAAVGAAATVIGSTIFGVYELRKARRAEKRVCQLEKEIEGVSDLKRMNK